MLKMRFATLAALVATSLVSSAAIAGEPPSAPDILPTPTDQSSWDVPGWYIIDGVDSLSQDEVNGLGAEYNLSLTPTALESETRIELAEIPANLMERLREDSRVRTIEPLSWVKALYTPNDPLLEKQWHMERVGMPSAWNFSTGRGVVVAVVDTGVACEDHGPFRKGTDLNTTECVSGWNFVSNNAHAYDDQGHGSHVAGTIAQSTGNNFGAAGIAFNASLMPVKVLDANGSGTNANVADGIRWAGDHGADVINLSLGGPRDSQILKDAVASARKNGAVVIAAAGNSGGSVGYPGGTEGVVGVSATGQDDKLAVFSSRGPEIDIAAPGVEVTQQTICNGGKGGCERFASFNGTSMASPHVAGVAALVMNRGVTDVDAVESVLKSTARVVDDSASGKKLYGAGILDASNATRTTFLKQTGVRIVLLALVLLFLYRKLKGTLNAETIGGAVLTGIGPLAVLPFITRAPNTAVELLTRPLGDWSIFLGLNVHQWLPFANALIPFALTTMFFHLKQARNAVAGVSLGTAAYLAAIPILGQLSGPLGGSLLTIWCLGNAALCVMIAKTNLTPDKA
jgi:serine protease